MQNSYKIDVIMDGAVFRDFLLFDSFKYRKLWKRPLFFAVMFVIFSLLCFAMQGIREQAALLGTVLLVIGLGLPLIYFMMFFRTVADQVKRLKLDKPRLFYTILLTDAEDGIIMSARNAEDRRFRWADAERAYRSGDVVYLYVSQGSAVVLPFKDVKGGGDALWKYLGERLGEGKLTTC
ncbi:MAG: YcxB family protein [Eubacteriales bacterium]|nr:YcxB family protein [Eubacteriales bacterium]